MKTLLISILALGLALAGCGSKGGSAAECGAAVNKGVDTMMSTVKTRMESMNVPPEQIAKVADAGAKLKDVITKRCIEDKWSKEVMDCYAAAASQPELRSCREKLPKDQADKLHNEEMQVMASMMGGMRPGRGMHGMMGGSGMTMAPAGSGMAPPPAPTGSAGSASTGSAGSAH